MAGTATRPGGDLTFVRLAGAPDDLVRDFHAGLLRSTFPPDELESLDDLRATLATGADGVLALDGERIVGGVVHEPFVGGAVRLVGYLVVDASMRGRGLGPRLLAAARAQSDSGLVLGEIEDPRHFAVSADDDPVARVRFWARLGCRLLPLPYVQPALHDGARRVRHLLLIALPQGDDPLPEAVPGRLVGDFLTEYFAASEGTVSPQDPDLRPLLERCEAPTLRLWPLDRLDVVDVDGADGTDGTDGTVHTAADVTEG